LDAANSVSYPGSGTAWRDLSGNSQNGTLTNGPTFNSGNGGSIVFDGSDDFVLGASNLGISGNAEFSICYWARWDGATFSSNWPSAVGNNSTGTTNLGLSTTWSQGRIALDFWNNRFRANNALAVQTWYYVCFTKTPGPIESTSKLYANGVELQGALEGGNTTPNITNSPFVVGRLDSSRCFNGKVSQVTIYNRALSQEEIQRNFNVTRSRYGL
jgi:hypothetical protein